MDKSDRVEYIRISSARLRVTDSSSISHTDLLSSSCSLPSGDDFFFFFFRFDSGLRLTLPIRIQQTNDFKSRATNEASYHRRLEL